MTTTSSGRVPAALLLVLAAIAAPCANGQWIWMSDTVVDSAQAQDETSNPTNTFVYFRTTVNTTSPTDGWIAVAADSNAAIFVDGVLRTRKLTRYAEQNITADVYSLRMDAGPHTIIVRVHSWGNIETFQRTGETKAGLHVRSSFGVSTANPANWQCAQALEHVVHSDQVIGVAGGAHRIRFPQIVNATQPSPFNAGSSKIQWTTPIAVTDGPWPEMPPFSETTAAGQQQCGDVVAPYKLLNSGRLLNVPSYSTDAYSIQSDIMAAQCQPSGASLLGMSPIQKKGEAGDSFYWTYDFNVPVHGYPQIAFGTEQTQGVVVDIVYTEKPFDLYSGDQFVNKSGCINPYGIVGKGYGDRIITAAGQGTVELPDERTARWALVHVRFLSSGTVHIDKLQIQSWMFCPDANLRRQAFVETGDADFQTITNLSMVFARIGMSDTYVDTPGREDGQWIEDARPRALLAARWFNDTSLRQVMIRHQAEAQRPDGSMHPFPPSNYPATASVDWSVQWVASMYDDFAWTRLTARVQRFWPELKLYWDTVLKGLGPDGVWSGSCLNDIRVTPSCPSGATVCSSGIVTPWIIERLRFSATMAAAAGQVDTCQDWASAACDMEAAFQKYHIRPASDDTPAHIAAVIWQSKGSSEWQSAGVLQAAHTVAVYTDLLNATFAEQVMDYVFPAPEGSPSKRVQRWNNPSFLRRALKALSHVNRTDRAIAHLKERFSQYLPGNPKNPVDPELQGTLGGPLPEYWISRIDAGVSPGQKDSAQPVDGTGSHGWTAVALEWMHTHVLGVQEHPIVLKDREQCSSGTLRARLLSQPPLITVQPDDGNGTLPSVQGLTYISLGSVGVDWQPAARSLDVDLDLMALDNMQPSVQVIAPRSCPSTDALTVNSKPTGGKIVQSGQRTVTVQGNGKWSFSCSCAPASTGTAKLAPAFQLSEN